MNSALVKPLLIVGGVILLIIIVISVFAGTNNRVVVLEENINTAQSNISKEEQRRADLFNNLADAVQAYDKHEQGTLQAVIEARQVANGGNVEQASLMLAAVVEQYPQLQSQKNYQTAMTEFSVTENRLAGYRELYNNEVRSYNNYTRSFWTKIVLSLMGYERQDFKYLDYEVDKNEHRDLFGE